MRKFSQIREDIMRAQGEGRQARINGDGLDANPYAMRADAIYDNQAWRDGWMAQDYIAKHGNSNMRMQ